MAMALLRGSRDENKRTEISTHETIKECFSDIHQIIRDEHFESYYYRYAYMKETDTLEIDYGSWSDFFFVKGCKDAPDFLEYLPGGKE